MLIVEKRRQSHRWVWRHLLAKPAIRLSLLYHAPPAQPYRVTRKYHRVYNLIPGSPEGYRAAFAANPWVHPQIIESCLADPSVTATWASGILYQLCYLDRQAIAFVVYGEFEGFEGTNNLIGIFTVDLLDLGG